MCLIICLHVLGFRENGCLVKKACESGNFFILNNAIDAKMFVFNKNIRVKKEKNLI